MARSSFLVYYFSRRRFSESFRSFFFIATCLSLTTSLFILFYISSTSKLFIQPDQTLFLVKSSLGSSSISPPLPTHQIIKYSVQNPPRFAFESVEACKSLIFRVNGSEEVEKRWSLGTLKPIASNGNYVNNEVFHNRDIFIEDYGEMNRSFKIYVYPHKKDDPFANALLPVKFKPGGNYASESYFKKVLMESHFITKDPTEADLFFLPFSIATLRYDPRVGVGGIQDFIRAYIYNISQNYPYWNRSGGADHFYIACHSIGRSAMEKVEKVKYNAIQVVCSSSYFLSGYVAHKDASLPQIWPRQGYQPYLASSKSADFGVKLAISRLSQASKSLILRVNGSEGVEKRWSLGTLKPIGSNGNYANNEVFHDRDIFIEDYGEMNRSFKIYVYPHKKDDPFANALLPVKFKPGGNYASESYFKKALMKSHFITKDPAEADLFFLPFSIATLRYDPRVGVGGIQDFIRAYIYNISQNYPYWNRSGGADHFYIACHSIGRSAMEKVEKVKFNAIQVVCSSSYFLSGYVAHKDASLPQIWPRQGYQPYLASSKRKKLAFFAGSVNSPVRKKLLEVWRNDSEIAVHFGRLKTPYSDELLGSKFCLHVKGFEVNTARIGDAIYYGCVPLIIANHYDLPFADILNWKSFSLVVDTFDIPLLKKILHGISSEEYEVLHSNVLKVRKHFQWHLSPLDYDAFYMVMYELWLRRNSVRVESF
ncbi:hypothetical protein HHK36_032813 [Tetracentron sinense]|uniref:Exostosin GT47 domain-containing protein n=1 Tax=Tetracentron sinense TaxID=13715 RepID=A0A835CXA5_TETSI|nr:hypothetical protein HHK36_032813 [Tetracentron sinense]